MPSQRLLRFEQLDPATLQLVFQHDPRQVAVMRYSEVPDKLRRAEPTAWFFAAAAPNNTVTLHLDEAAQKNEYSLVLVFNCNGSAHHRPKLPMQTDPAATQMTFVELIGQPAGWLQQMFIYERAEGYTILGRRELVVTAAVPPPGAMMKFNGQPKITMHPEWEKPLPGMAGRYPRLETAAALIRWLWDHNLHAGPVSADYSSFVRREFPDKIWMLESGDYAVMCQGMRDLFLHATTAFHDLRARGVDGSDSVSLTPALTVHSHATVEV